VDVILKAGKDLGPLSIYTFFLSTKLQLVEFASFRCGSEEAVPDILIPHIVQSFFALGFGGTTRV
jgi:hypothetical protein